MEIYIEFNLNSYMYINNYQIINEPQYKKTEEYCDEYLRI